MSEQALAKASEVLEALGAQGSSDLHLTSDRGAYYVKDKLTKRLKLPEPMAKSMLEALIEDVVIGGSKAFERLYQAGASIDRGGDFRGRLAVAREIGGLSGTIRLIPRKIPTADSLGLPSTITSIARRPAGLFLVVGQTGSGKSTTIAAMQNDFLQSHNSAMYTIEDPIEYIYPAGPSLIVQREVGLHVESFAAGVEDAKRRHPRVIVVGEIRNVETARSALLAAASGHLVVSTMHAGTAAEAVDSFTSMFTPEEQGLIRTQLAQSLVAIVAQQLVAKPGGGMALAQEIAFNTPEFAELLRGSGDRSNDTKYIQQLLLSAAGTNHGMVSMEESLARLAKQEVITLDSALVSARDQNAFAEKARQLGLALTARAAA
jgi:twitching motility protein PilT